MCCKNLSIKLLIFSLTFVSGLAFVGLFFEQTDITELPQPPIIEQNGVVKKSELKNCVKEYEKFDRWNNETDSFTRSPLSVKRYELLRKLVKYNSEKLERELEKVNIKVERLKKLQRQKKEGLDLQRRYGYDEFYGNKNLLYKENCYEHEF
jgi:hypothetical protein